ncbi:hypothetical protein BKA69DRAFT_1087023, partial [Paraphysoderma sedebokerense]
MDIFRFSVQVETCNSKEVSIEHWANTNGSRIRGQSLTISLHMVQKKILTPPANEFRKVSRGR